MGEFLTKLFDSSDFTPRRYCGGWYEELIQLHSIADILIWLAYVSIPIVLVFFSWRYRRILPFHYIFLLFGAFILACGFTHFVDWLVFRTPIYRFAGLLKMFTAVISWVTVFALIGAVPRALAWVDAAQRRGVPRAEPEPAVIDRGRDYVIAGLASALAVTVRWMLDSHLGSDHAFVIPLSAVVAVAWYGGFGPAVFALVTSLTAVTYCFVEPRHNLLIARPSDQLAAGLFLTCGVGTALLGGAQRDARRRSETAAAQLRRTNAELAASQQSAAETLAQLQAFLDNAPVGIAFYDQSGRYRRVNKYLAAANGLSASAHEGRRPDEIRSDFPAALAAAVGRSNAPEAEPETLIVEMAAPNGEPRTWRAQVFPVRDGVGVGVGVIREDITDRVRAEDALRRASESLKESEERFRAVADSIPQLAWMTEPDGDIIWYNRRWYEFTGTTFDEMKGWGWQAVHAPEELPRVVAKFKAHLTSGEPWEDTFPLRRADGEYRWFLSRARPIRDEFGRVTRWFGTNTDVTEQRELEAALRASADRFRGLTEAVPNMVWTSDPSGEVTYFNRRWIDYTGLDVTAARAQGWAVAVHPDDAPALLADWRAGVAEGRDSITNEYRLRRAADGAYRWVMAKASPLRRPDGSVELWIGSITDVDDQKRLQIELRQSLDRFRTLTETVPQMVWTAAADGIVTYFNRRWQEFTGLTVEEANAPAGAGCIHPDDAAGLNESWRAAVRGGADHFSREFRLRRSEDGTFRWVLSTALPLWTEDGTVEQWVGSITDIDDQKREAERLDALVRERTALIREQQEFLDAILENVADGIVACDADGKLKLFNSASREFHGLPAEPVGPDDWAARYSLFEGDGVTPMAPENIPLARAMRGERVRDAEMVIRPSGRPERYLVASGQPLRDAHGRNLGAVVSMRDMTDRRRAEVQLQAYAKALKASNEELEKFAYIASHDLQEPLRKIQAFGDRLVRRYRDAIDDQGREFLDRIQNSATRMRRLIDDLLSFSRVSTKSQPFASVDLAAVVADVLDDLETPRAESGADVRVGPLPSVSGDPTQMRQLFQNLIGNALKFRNADRPPVIRVECTPWNELPADAPLPPAAGRGWRITVVDNGIGFEPEFAERIFEVFQRLHGREKYEGTGIGLAICRKIVDRHGGRLTATSSPGGGATFVIDLPADGKRTATNP